MIKLENLSASYGKQPVIGGACASFEKGKLTAIIGVNGSGKSTLLKAMLGILPCTQGNVFIDGAELSALKRNEIAKRAAYLSQGKEAPDMTVGEMVLHGRFPYLSYPRRYTKKDRSFARAAMEQVGISGLADKPLHTLSGGMRQTAYIAMALAQDTDYILLDEPTTYLDISHQLELMAILRKLADNGKGVITVMHDLPMAFDFSDEIAILHGGKIICKGEPLAVATAPYIKSIFGVGLKYIAEENKYIYSGI
ncbi:MAG: ABC transporter ATP-binding protein [Clostridia bacterium]|nr:ABC transporter ATP-binding protein [Clostridia bacterium]